MLGAAFAGLAILIFGMGMAHKIAGAIEENIDASWELCK